ncbi:hypothetical protein ACGC1H_007327 [Rhizoctonia solani]
MAECLLAMNQTSHWFDLGETVNGGCLFAPQKSTPSFAHFTAYTLYQTRLCSLMSNRNLSRLAPQFPNGFNVFLCYCRSLRFNHKPDYSYLCKLLRNLLVCKGCQYDYVFDSSILHSNDSSDQSHRVTVNGDEHANSIVSANRAYCPIAHFFVYALWNHPIHISFQQFLLLSPFLCYVDSDFLSFYGDLPSE